MLKDKRICGIAAGSLTAAVFCSISLIVAMNFLKGAPWYFFSSALMCEGYRYTKGGTAIKLGFAFAVVYLQTGNILLPMILHFVYDVIIAFGNYTEWRETEIFSVMLSWRTAAYVVMFVVSLINLIRKEKTENIPYGGKDEDTYTQARRA